MRASVATSILLLLTLAGIGWTVYTALALGKPEVATCRLIFPACQVRPIITGAWFLLLVGLSLESLRGGTGFWRVLIVGVAWGASGHLHWPAD